MKLIRRNNKGFSLVEMLAATMLLSGGVITICAISNKSMLGTRGNREYELAWEVLDRQFSLIDYVGIDDFIEQGQLEGKLSSSEMAGQVYYWFANITEGDADNLYNVNIAVYWGSKNLEGRVSATTVFNGNGTLGLAGSMMGQ